jgi:hypothetical protein
MARFRLGTLVLRHAKANISSATLFATVTGVQSCMMSKSKFGKQMSLYVVFFFVTSAGPHAISHCCDARENGDCSGYDICRSTHRSGDKSWPYRSSQGMPVWLRRCHNGVVRSFPTHLSGASQCWGLTKCAGYKWEHSIAPCSLQWASWLR